MLLHLQPEIEALTNGYSRKSVKGGYIAHIEYFHDKPEYPNLYLKILDKKSNHNSVKEYQVHQWFKSKLYIPIALCQV